MGKPRPARRRDRRTGISPWQRHGKKPHKYTGHLALVDETVANAQHTSRRGRIHAGAWSSREEKTS